jgi:type IV secretion system protein VirB1
VIEFAVLAQQCAPHVEVSTLRAIVSQESGFNPYAIGVVRGRLERQPRDINEAIATVRELERLGYNYSAGIAQINKSNWRRYGLTIGSVFDPCTNLAAGAKILAACFSSATARDGDEQQSLRAALSCYYSGNFRTGFDSGYVQSVVAHALVGHGSPPSVSGVKHRAVRQERQARKPVYPPLEGVQTPFVDSGSSTSDR